MEYLFTLTPYMEWSSESINSKGSVTALASATITSISPASGLSGIRVTNATITDSNSILSFATVSCVETLPFTMTYIDEVSTPLELTFALSALDSLYHVNSAKTDVTFTVTASGILSGGASYTASDSILLSSFSVTEQLTAKGTGVQNPVTNFEATEKSNNSVLLTWTNPTNIDLSGVHIKRVTDYVLTSGIDISGTTVYNGTSTTSFIDMGTSLYNTYAYTISAISTAPAVISVLAAVSGVDPQSEHGRMYVQGHI